eukprot:c17217_g1_i1.p1 GENE.c17217_g1_i1~~c17217_g1_i1.p1  ORF type:complete len:111 (+),score=28.72 c17217_g1_i1:72-404(+)
MFCISFRFLLLVFLFCFVNLITTTKIETNDVNKEVSNIRLTPTTSLVHTSTQSTALAKNSWGTDIKIKVMSATSIMIVIYYLLSAACRVTVSVWKILRFPSPPYCESFFL